jgi:hypothetical protein
MTALAATLAILAGAAAAAGQAKPWFGICAAWVVLLCWLQRSHPQTALMLATAPVLWARPIALTGALDPGLNDVALVCTLVVSTPRLRPIQSALARRALGATLAGSILALLVAHEPRIAMWGVARTALATMLAVAAYHAVRQSAASLATFIAWLGGIASTGAILQKLGLYQIVGPPYLTDLPDSFFGYYSVFAGFAGLALVMTAGLLLIHHRRSLALIVLAVLNGVGVVLTTSRGGFLVAIVGVGMLLAASAHSPRLLLRWAAIGGVVLAGVLTYVPSDTVATLSARVTNQDLSANSDAQRSKLQQVGAEAATHQPLGLGYGNFNAYLTGHPVAEINRGFFHAHQLVIQTFLDGGWLAGASLLGFCVAARRGWRHRRTHPMAVVYAAGFVGLLAQGFGDYLLHEPMMLVVWLALPVAVLAALTPVESPRDRRAVVPSMSDPLMLDDQTVLAATEPIDLADGAPFHLE